VGAYRLGEVLTDRYWISCWACAGDERAAVDDGQAVLDKLSASLSVAGSLTVVGQGDE
jgi:hypothetical protein